MPNQPFAVLPWQEGAWWFLTLAMFLVWWAWFAGNQSREFSLAERILAAFISTVCQIVATTLILGIAHYLSWWPLGLLNAGITIILAILCGRGGVGGVRGAGRKLVSDIGATFAVGWRLVTSSMAVFLIGVTALLVVAWVVYLGQLLPPYCWDAWSYHLSWGVFARQEGHLGPFDQPMPWINVFPKNTDILFLWWILGAGTERWANVVQAPFGLASVLASYLLARRVGARREDAAAVSLLVLSVPVVINQMWMALVDVTVMGGALSSLAFLSRRRLTHGTLALAGCAAGFIVGTKGSSMYVFMGLSIFLLYRLLPLGMDSLRRSPTGRLKNMVVALALFGGLAFAFGSYFYLRNWVLYGNPTALYQVEVGPIQLFEGKDVRDAHFCRGLIGGELYDALERGPEWPIVLDGFFDPKDEFSEITRIGGWGSAWTTLMLPAIPVAFLWALLKRRWSAVAIIVACLIPYFLFTANHTWTRYHLYIIGAGTTSLAFLLSNLRRSRWTNIMLCIAALSMMATDYVAATHRPLLRPAVIAEARQQPYMESDRFAFFSSWHDEQFAQTWLSIQEPGTTLGFSHFAPDWKMLALWNPSFSNHVVYVPWLENGNAWEQSLRDREVDFVYTWPDTESLSYASAHPEGFDSMYEGAVGGIHRIVKSDDQ